MPNSKAVAPAPQVDADRLLADAKANKLPFVPEHVPKELRELDRWLLWHFAIRKGKVTKPPLSPTRGTEVDVQAAAHHVSFDHAVAALDRCTEADGIGFALMPEDDIVGVDLDHCVTDTGDIEPWAMDIVDRLDSYSEFSPSGKGLRIIVRGQLPPGRRRKGSIEMYQDKRYVTITGHAIAMDFPGRPETVENRQDALEALHRDTFPAPTVPTNSTPPAPLDASDDAILEKAFASRQGLKIQALWKGEWKSDYPSQSEADLALCDHLAFWFREPERIASVFQRSELYRPKWGRDDYRSATIEKALEGRTEFYTPRLSEVPDNRDSHNRADPPEPSDDNEADSDLFVPRWFNDPDREPVIVPPGWWVEDLLAPGYVTASGSWKTGKSWLLLALSMAIATGTRIFGKGARQGNVAWLQLDMPDYDFIRYARLLREGMKLPVHAMPFLSSNRIDLKQRPHQQGLVSTLKDLGTEILIIDSGRAASSVRENESDEVAALVRGFFCGQLRDELGISTALIAHGAKSGDGGTRGSGDFDAAADSCLAFTKPKDGEKVTVKGRGRHRPLEFSFIIEDLEQFNGGVSLIDMTGQIEVTDDDIEALMEAVPTNGDAVTITGLRKKVKGSNAKVTAIVDEAERRELVRTQGVKPRKVSAVVPGTIGTTPGR